MPDILLVHGSCHGAWAFRDLAPALQDLGYTARAIDLPGHGNTPTPSPISHWSYTQIRFWTRLRIARLFWAIPWRAFPFQRRRKRHLIGLIA